ncbi:MAG: LptF/LptG family permease [Candidatus Omnitrophota bacterium]
MKIIDKYITRGFVWPFLYCLFVFLLLYVVGDLLGHLDSLVKQNVPFDIIKTYYLASLPYIFVQTTPFAVLLASVFLFSNLNRHNEIIALRASGVDTLRIITPVILLGLAISLAVFLVNDKVVPESSVISNTIKELRFDRDQKEKGDKLENITVFGRDGKLFYAREFDLKAKKLKDVVMLVHDNNQILKRKITAESMEWTGKSWKFHGADSFRFDREGNVLGKPAIFRTPKIIDFNESPESLLKKQTQPDFMNYAQLRDYIHLLALESKSTARKLLVDLHYKLALPFTSVVIMLIGIPFALKRTRSKAMASMGLAIVIALVFYGANAISLALGKGGFVPPIIAAWAANFVFAALGIYLLAEIRS